MSWKKKGAPFDRDMPVGIMIEVPAAALCADLLAPEVDFFSIGTNDLIQYTVAADRVNPHVADLYRPTHPAVIRLIKRTIDAATDNGIWTGICGEMAGDIRLTPLLIGLGVEELSVGPQQVPSVGQAIRSLSYAECAAMADEALRHSRSQGFWIFRWNSPANDTAIYWIERRGSGKPPDGRCAFLVNRIQNWRFRPHIFRRCLWVLLLFAKKIRKNAK